MREGTPDLPQPVAAALPAWWAVGAWLLGPVAFAVAHAVLSVRAWFEPWCGFVPMAVLLVATWAQCVAAVLAFALWLERPANRRRPADRVLLAYWPLLVAWLGLGVVGPWAVDVAHSPAGEITSALCLVPSVLTPLVAFVSRQPAARPCARRAPPPG
jgi:hypothetical protein